jgi:hypothetical protein
MKSARPRTKFDPSLGPHSPRFWREIALLTDRARRDPLTGLLNRRGFEERFDAELDRARRSGSSLSVVVGDLDRLKRVNDALGHPGGDAAELRGHAGSQFPPEVVEALPRAV